MAWGRVRLAVVTRDVGDQAHLAGCEGRQLRVGDQVEGVLVVSLVRHELADVVQQGSGLEDGAAVPVEAVQ